MRDIPSIQVVVLGYNSRTRAQRCLESVLDLEYGAYEVVYLDNDSDDGSTEAIAEEYPEVTVKQFDTNLGFAAAYDRWLSQTDASFVALLNPDTVVPKGWLSAYADIIEQSEGDVAVWGGKIRLYETDRLHYAGAKFTPIGSGIEPDLYLSETRSPSKIGPTAAGCGANMVVDVDKYRSLGGFDENYFLYFEDTDFCWRAWLWGYRVVYAPDATVEHEMGGVIGTENVLDSPRRAYHTARNRRLTLFKNAGLVRLLYGTVISTGYEGLLVVRALWSKRLQTAVAIVRGVIAFLWLLPLYIGRRREVQRGRVRSDRELADMGLFVSLRDSIEFFLRLRNRYSANDD